MAKLEIFTVGLFLAVVLNFVQCSQNELFESSVLLDSNEFPKDSHDVTLQPMEKRTLTSKISRSIQKTFTVGHRITGKNLNDFCISFCLKEKKIYSFDCFRGLAYGSRL